MSDIRWPRVEIKHDHTPIEDSYKEYLEHLEKKIARAAGWEILGSGENKLYGFNFCGPQTPIGKWIADKGETERWL